MKVQVLVAAMHRTDHNILKEMNISSDAIVVNQCNYDKVERFNYRGHEILFLSLNERGVGLSRNTALMRATGDICVFADEDVIYVDNYSEIIKNEFEKNPKADVILFNVKSLNSERPLSVIKKNGKLGRKKALRYGCVRMAIKREKQAAKNIWFSLLFGGGAEYSSGEDTIFLQDCIKKGLKVYTSTEIIAYVKQEQSSWFKGYNDKLFYDKGVLLGTVMPRFSWLYAIGLSYKYTKKTNSVSFYKILKLMYKGILQAPK